MLRRRSAPHIFRRASSRASRRGAPRRRRARSKRRASPPRLRRRVRLGAAHRPGAPHRRRARASQQCVRPQSHPSGLTRGRAARRNRRPLQQRAHELRALRAADRAPPQRACRGSLTKHHRVGRYHARARLQAIAHVARARCRDGDARRHRIAHRQRVIAGRRTSATASARRSRRCRRRCRRPARRQSERRCGRLDAAIRRPALSPPPAHPRLRRSRFLPR